MENVIKYRLKSPEELKKVLAGTDKVFLITCGGCFRKEETDTESDCGTFKTIAADLGKTLVGCAKMDFLCNQHRTFRQLPELIPEDAESIFVCACGLGVQTVAELAEIPVYTAADSVGGTGHRGMALTEKTCGACAQCYLNMTGGICPVVDCSKSLLNGQCGGARNGKCEIDPNKDCAWEKIRQRLQKQGRLGELVSQGVQLWDYSKVNHKVIREYVSAIREKRFEGFFGGVYPEKGSKPTAGMAPVRLPEPDTVAISLFQTAGVPSRCVVSVGDYVKVGQLLGEAMVPISSNVHASVSGTVIAIEDRPHATKGIMVLSVVIKNDGKHILHESVKPNKPLEELSGEEIIRIIRNAGIIGMGGAGFPMDVKLSPGKPVDTVILNGCECEPLLTADHQLMLCSPDEVIFGLKAIMKVLNAPRAIIVIEDNKPDAIRLMEEKVAGETGIEVRSVRTKYPQGGEKVLIRRILGRSVPSNGLPADVGCMVSNVTTTKVIADAIQLGLPVTERIVTVTGSRVKHPGNYIVKNGMPLRDLLDNCGGILGEGEYVVKVGGPMTGLAQEDLRVGTTRCTNGVVVLDADNPEPQGCVRCGRCADVCPMELMPLHFIKQAETGDWQGMKDSRVAECMECRCCQYVCPSKEPLAAVIKYGKSRVREMK